MLFQNLQTFRVSDTKSSILHQYRGKCFSEYEKSQQDLFTKLKRTPIYFLSLFRNKSNKIKNLIKHVKLKEKVLLLAHKIYKPAGYYAYA